MSETFITDVISGGRITIKKSVRKKLHLTDGDTIRVIIDKINPEDIAITPKEKFVKKRGRR